MSLKTNISHEGDITILEFQGKLNFEDTVQLHEDISALLQLNRQVVIDFNELDFVGSSGIVGFLQTIREVGLKHGRMPRFCNVGREFRQILEALRIGADSIHESRTAAAASFFRKGLNERN